jgi:hypothetical protein
MTILPAAAITGSDICRGIRDNQNTQNFICMGLFADPTNLASIGQIEVNHRISYLSAPFQSTATADPTIRDKLYGILGDLMTGRQIAKVAFHSFRSPRRSSAHPHFVRPSLPSRYV